MIPNMHHKQRKKRMILEEIIEDAAELSLENQRWLLAMAKGMAYSKQCAEKKMEKSGFDVRKSREDIKA